MKTLIATRKIDIKNSFLFKYKSILILFFIMISAVFFGLIMQNSESGNGIFYRIIDVFGDYIISVKNYNKPEIFSGLLLSSFVCYAVIALFSTSIIGAPLIYAVIFFKIAGLSTVLFAIYSEFGLSGIEYSLLVLLPGKYFMILSLLILADSSSQLCNVIVKDIQSKPEKIKNYIMILVFSAVILLISVIIDYFTLTTFAGLFDFTG